MWPLFSVPASRPVPSLSTSLISVSGALRDVIFQNLVVSSEGSFVEDLPRGALGYHFVSRDI